MFSCFIFWTLKILFHMLQIYPISLALTKFYFYGTFFLLVIDGTIERSVFFLLREINMPFYFSYGNKIANSALIFLMFIILILSFSLFVFLFRSYKQLLKYFHSHSRMKFRFIVANTVDRGISCVLFGIAHRMLLTYPNIQLLVLMSI